MIKVLLVDDHRIIRDGLRALLMGSKEVNIIGECSDGLEVIPYLEENVVDVVLMDINMPKQNGIETTKQVVEKFPHVAVLALTMHDEETYITKILQAGASGYTLKNANRSEIIEAIQKVKDGNTFFSDEVSTIMMSKYLKKTPEKLSSMRAGLVSLEDLTKREKEILQLIVEEFTNVEIGEKLFISPRTVDTHRRNLLQKLGVKNTAGLVKYAILHQLV